MKYVSENFDKELGETLKKLRTDKRMSLRDVSAITKLSPSTIHYYETGKISISINNLIILCDLYGTDYISVLRKIR